MSARQSYEVAVVGGGPAGLTAAIYTTRLGHRTAVFEREGGRHAAVSHVHNLYGVSEDVSGRELARHAVAQFREYGGDYHLDPVEAVRRSDDRDARFSIESAHASVDAERVVFATGFTDVPPSVPGLERFTGRGLHYCLHCDAYGLGDSPAYVLGHGDDAVHVATVLLNVTADVDLLLDGREPEWSEETGRTLDAHPVEVVETEVVGAFPRGGGGGESERGGESGDGSASTGESETAASGGRGRDADEGADPWLGGLSFADGTDREYRGGFAMYGKEYNAELAEGLGCELAEDGALAVDEDHETSVTGAYAVGDVTHGQNQTAIALGDGARAGVAIHKDLRRFPRAAADPDDVEAADVPAASADLRARMRLVRERACHAGLRGPPPER